MRQRLVLAAALLGDPEAIVLDEPTNGLDPQGHRWLRDFLRARAGEGRAVLLSFHVLTDVAETVDRVVVISRVRLVADRPIAALGQTASVRVRSPDADVLAGLLSGASPSVQRGDTDFLNGSGLDAGAIDELAAEYRIVLHELTPTGGSLEDLFFELTRRHRRDANRWDAHCSSNECTTGSTKPSLARRTGAATTQPASA